MTTRDLDNFFKKANKIISSYYYKLSVLDYDYFIIASGKSSPQVKALAEYAMDAVEKEGGEVRRKEGMSEARWVVVDFGDVILHVFHDETRLFYNLERLWASGTNIEKFDD